MYKSKKILGLITARGGSKGIPRKNIFEINGKPMIYYTIDAACKSKFLTRTIISTDDKEIITVSKKYGADVPFVRPAKYAKDDSTHIDVVRHAIDWIKKNNNEEFDYVMILQPTSPLRLSEDIDGSIQMAIDTNADSVMSMYELVDLSLRKLKRIQDGRIYSLLKEEESWTSRRQDIEKIYKRNCAIYLTKTELLLSGDLFGKVSLAYIMPHERSIDINVPEDVAVAEWFFKKLP